MWVLLQYIFIGSSRAIPMVKSIKIHMSEFKQHKVVIVQHQQIPFILIHRTPNQISQLKARYQGKQSLRSLNDKYFIALAIGTHYGCIVTAYQQNKLKESCSPAAYDYTGRSIEGEYNELIVPTMTYNSNTQFFNLTLR